MIGQACRTMTATRVAVALACCLAACGPNTEHCDVPDTGSAAAQDVEICVRHSEEKPACVSGDEPCETGGQCTDGLTCATVVAQDPCSTELDDGCRCRPIAFGRLSTGFRRLALQQGFAVGGMPSAVDTAEVPPRLTWQAPKDARLVACALFSCAPSFRNSGCSPTHETALFTIDNFEQCVLLFGAFPATQPGFVIGAESAYQAGPHCGPPEAGPRVVTELAAGCWAYDTTSIIAASELHPIRGSLLAGLPGLPQDGACPIDGAACYDASADVFGICLGGDCRPRCRSRVDCSLGASSPATDGTCGWSCRDVPGQELGACVPVP